MKYLKTKISNKLKTFKIKNLKLVAFSLISLTLASSIFIWFINSRPSHNPYFKETTKDSQYIYQNINQDFKVYLGDRQNPNTPKARFEISENKFVEIVAKDLDSQKIKLNNFSKNIQYEQSAGIYDIHYKILPNGLKEDIIIKTPPTTDSSSPTEFSFIVSYPDELEIKESLPNQLTFYEKNGGYVFHFTKPFMIDNKDQKTEDVKIKVNRIIPKPEEVDDQIVKYLVTFIPSTDWLNSSERQYPVILDPTIIHDDSSEFSGTHNRTTDSGSSQTPVLETSYEELQADINTVGLWHMNETSGSSATDSSGNGNTGTATGTTIVDGKLNKGRNFNGSSDSISFGNPTSLKTTSNLSVSAWIKTTSANNQAIYTKWDDNSVNERAILFAISSSGTLRFTLDATGNWSTMVNTYSSNIINDGQWHHVAGVYDGSTAKVYIDGKEAGSENYNSNIYNTPTDAEIGSMSDQTEWWFNGSIDEVRISNIARTPEEIKASASRRPYGTYTSQVIDFGQTPISLNSLSWTDSITPPNYPSGWSKFKPVLIDNTQNSQLTSYQVKVQVNYDSNMQTDFDDLRFTNQTGTNLDYWIEEKSDGVEAKVWVKVDTIPASSWNSIYMFYGNSGASAASDYNNTFTTFPTANPSLVWTKYNNAIPSASDTTGTNGQIPLGTAGKGDVSHSLDPSVIKDGSTYKMWYIGHDGTNGRVYYATSSDGLTWTKYDNTTPSASDTTSTNGRIPLGTSGKGDAVHAYPTSVIKDGSTYKMWYAGYDGSSVWRIYYATSSDGLTWTKYDNTIPSNSDTTSTNGRIPLGTSGKGDSNGTHAPSVIKDGSTYKMWYSGADGSGIWRTYYATSSDGLTWTKYDNTTPSASDTTSTNGRIPLGTSGKGDSTHTLRAKVIKTGSTYIITYGGHDGTNWRVYYATSSDGLTWTKYDNTTPSASDTTSTNGRIPLGTSGKGDVLHVYPGGFIQDGSKLKMWYAGHSGTNWRVYYATMPAIFEPVTTVGASIEFQTRTSANNSTWEAWKPTTNETAIAAMNADATNWVWDATSTYMPQAKSDESTIKMESTGSLKQTIGAPQVDANTVGLWRLEETSGTGAYIKDLSGNNNHGTPTGTSVTNGFYNKARSFNGTSDYIRVPAGSGSSLDIDTNPVTMEAWIKVNSMANNQMIVARGDYSTEGYALRLNNTTGKLNLGSHGGSNFDSTTTIIEGRWYHVAGVINGASSQLYINGQLDQSGTVNVVASNLDFYIGTDYDVSSQVYFFNGTIDEVRISNIARTAEAIAESYRAGRDHHLTKTISSTDLSSSNKIPFYIAADRPGTILEAAIGETSQSMYQPDANTVGLWHFDEDISPTTDGSCNITSGTVDINTSSCSGRSTADAVNFSSTTNTTAGSSTITTSTTPTGLSIGDEILIINLQGTAANYSNVGKYETRRITAINTNTLTLDNPTTNTYDGTTQKIMIQRIPNYLNVSISSGATLTASAWNGTKNGVLFFRSLNSVLNSGTISMNSKGYTSGSPLLGISYPGGSSGGGGGGGNFYYNQAGGGGGGGGGNGGSYGTAGSTGSRPGGGGGAAHTSGSDDGYGGAGGAGGANGVNGSRVGNGSASGGGGGGSIISTQTLGGAGVSGSSGGNGGAGNGAGIFGGGNGGASAGASNGSPGGLGGLVGSTFGTTDLSTLFLGTQGGNGGTGGGGGDGANGGAGGAGGAGGGIVVISTANLENSGSIVSNGAVGNNAGTTGQSASTYPYGGRGGGGGGGGGAGGSIQINANTATLGTSTITTAGGNAGNGTVGTNGVISGSDGIPGYGGALGAGGTGAQCYTGTIGTGGGGGGANGGAGGAGRINIRYRSSYTGSTSPAATTQTIESSLPTKPIKDSSGNSNHGTIAGATITQGKLGKARNFNGTSDLITIPHTNSLNVPTAWTVSSWVKINGTPSGNPAIFTDSYPGPESKVQFSLGFSNSTKALRVGFYNGTSWYTAITTDLVPSEEWAYVVGVYDGSAGTIKAYINGVLKATTTGVPSSIGNVTTEKRIGRRWDITDYINGIIDEVSLSNVARSATEIQQAYQYGLRTHPITIDFVTSPQASYTSGTSITINNPSGTSNLTDTLSVGDTIIIRQNENGTEYISQAEVANISNTSSTYGTVTLSSAFSSIPPTSGFTTNATVFKWQREYWDISNISPADRNATTKLDLRVIDGSQGFNFYLDDIRSNTNYLYQGFGNTITSTSNRYLQYRAIMTGGNFSTSTPSPQNSATAQIYRVNINHTLAENEKDGRPVASWKFDEGYGNTAYDETIGNHDATLNNMESTDWIEGRIGKALDLGGTNEYLSVANSADVNFADRSMSISTFINTTSSGATYTIVDKTNVSVGLNGYNLYINSSGKVVFEIGSGASVSSVTSNKSVNDGAWHSIVAVRHKSSSTIKIYIDGLLDNSTSDATGNIDSTANISIGRNSSSANYYIGKLDELSLHDYALSPNQAKEVHNRNSNTILGLPNDVNKGGAGPIAFWKLDEATGTTANDNSGNGNTGTLTNGPTWESNGKIGSALSFDGVNDYLSIPASSNFNFGTGNFTIGMWINSSSASTQYAFGLGNWGVDNLEFDFNDSGYEVWVYWNGTGTPYLRYDGNSVTDGKWHYITLSRSGTTMNLYIDGKVVGTTTSSANIGSSTGDLRIGKRSYSDSSYTWNGKIDQVKIYNYARTISQIHADMGGSPIAHWKLDEGYGTTAFDNMKNSNATITSATWTSGKNGKALSYTGSSSTTATISDPGYSNTISLWLYPTTSIASKTIITTGKLTTDSSSRPIYGNCTGTAIPLNQWTHLTAVSNGSGSCQIYQNGALTVSNSTGVTFGTSVNIGSSSYTGIIDEVKIYNYPLTADEIKIEHNQSSAIILGNPIDTNASGNSPIAFWKLDEATGTTANDNSGNGNTGTLTNGPVWESNGKIGSAILFDGVNDYLDFGNMGNNFGNTQSITMWIYPKDVSTDYDRIYSADDENTYPFTIGIRADGTLRFTDKNNINELGSKISLTANKWQHIAIVTTGSQATAKIFINGIDQTGIEGGSGFTFATRTTLASRSGTAGFFDGFIDDVKIYNYARTQRQIMFDYNNGGPIAHWKLDEASGTTAFDETDNNHDGTLNNMDDIDHINGKIGRALDFDGTDDNVSLTRIQPTSSAFTSSAWIKTTNSDSNATYISRAIIGDNNTTYVTHGLGINGGKVRYRYYNYNASAWQNLDGNITINDNNWHFITVTQDSSGAIIYVDGKVDNSNATNAGITIYNTNSIGALPTTGLNQASKFIGLIDDVKIYNYVRSANEIKQDYNQGVVLFQ